MSIFPIAGLATIAVVVLLAIGSLVIEHRRGRLSPMRVWTAATAPITALYCYLDASRSPWLEAQFNQVSLAIGLWAFVGVGLILLESVRGNKLIDEDEDGPLAPATALPPVEADAHKSTEPSLAPRLQ